jgi:hypothetical protein
MAAVEPAKERIARQLMEAVERLQGDIARVELWASALGGFSQPVPDYDPAKSRLDQFMLPRTSDEPETMADSEPLERAENRQNAAPKTHAKRGLESR